MAPRVFYTVIVESVADEESSFVQVFWTWAMEMGEAIGRVLAVAREEGIAAPVAAEIDPYDIDTLPDDVDEIRDTGVFTSGARFFYPTETGPMPLPQGIILSALEGEQSPEEIQPAFDAWRDDDLYRLEASVPGEKLVPTFLALVTALPAIRVVWTEITHEWDNEDKIRFYANESITTVDAIRDFLESHPRDIVGNGYVKFTAYSETGATNIVINDHKEIAVMTYDEGVWETARNVLATLGLPEVEDRRSIQYGYYHWHYAPAGAKTRDALVNYLEGLGFFLWKEIDPEDDK